MISKADPSDYKQELARLGYVLKLDAGKEEEKSPTKKAVKMSDSLAVMTLEALIQQINSLGVEALEENNTMENLNN